MANHKNNSNMDPEGSEYFKQAVASKKEIATWIVRDIEKIKKVETPLERGLSFLQINHKYPKYLSRRLWAELKGISLSTVNNDVKLATDYLNLKSQEEL